MNRLDIISNIAIHVINHCELKTMESRLCPLIYRVIAYGKQIPEGACYLIPDRRYHDRFPLVYGFKFAFSKLTEPPFYLTMSIVNAVAARLRIPLIGNQAAADLILHTLVIDFFEKNPGLLKPGSAKQRDFTPVPSASLYPLYSN